MTNYKRIDEKAWLDFGKNLLVDKDSDRQVEFLQNCRSTDTFLRYMEENLLSRPGSVIGSETATLNLKFTEKEFICPPKDTQRKIWNVFKGESTEIMSSCGFWGYVTIQLLEDGAIESNYLAAKLNGITSTGLYMIDTALTSNKTKTIDRRVRRVLRSMCNPSTRGKRIVFNDYYFGKTYWRWCWANRMSGPTRLNVDKILSIFDDMSYGTFAGKMHTGKSYIGSENVLGGLLLYLNRTNEKQSTGKRLEKIIDKIGYLSAWKGIEVQSIENNKKDIQKIADTCR